MNSKPILFSAPMIRALLDGRKTQTRRVLKTQPETGITENGAPYWKWGAPRGKMGSVAFYNHGAESLKHSIDCFMPRKCPYGKPGDLLWVRETWFCHSDHGEDYDPAVNQFLNIFYRSTDPDEDFWATDDETGEKVILGPSFNWRPSVFMPRWASRITLRIKSVRVERLNQISNEDSIAEGLTRIEYKGESFGFDGGNPTGYGSATGAFRALWEFINGAGSWAANPWVWVLEFEVINKNVDEVMCNAGAR